MTFQVDKFSQGNYQNETYLTTIDVYSVRRGKKHKTKTNIGALQQKTFIMTLKKKS